MNGAANISQRASGQEPRQLAPEKRGPQQRTYWSLAGCMLGCFAVCLAYYVSTLTMGFLHDDLLHFDQAWRALHGDAADFLHNFYSNWGGSDLMRSYRPLISLSFFTDCLLWGSNAGGFHFTNLLAYAGTCFFVGLVADELGRIIGLTNRLAAAVCAAFLFACYPLHPESVAWIVGRVDLLCTFFYLAAVFCYFRFCRSSDRRYLLFGLGAFLCSLVSKEMAVTLPVVLSFSLLLPHKDSCSAPAGVEDQRKRQLQAIVFFWGVLAAFAAVRTLFLGTVVGGYGGNSFKQLAASLKNLLDKATLLKIAVPVNEEFHDLHIVMRTLLPAYLLLAPVALMRLFRERRQVRVALFLLLWIAVGVLPTFQIWHIYPNLIGGRLFYLSSAPLMILVSFLVVPDAAKSSSLFGKLVTYLAVAGLVYLVTLWSWLVFENLKPWREASRRVDRIVHQLQHFADTVAPPRKILLLHIPRDYKGAAMLTRSRYLAVLAKPPFISRDFTQQLLSTEQRDLPTDASTSAENEVFRATPRSAIYFWCDQFGEFLPWGYM